MKYLFRRAPIRSILRRWARRALLDIVPMIGCHVFELISMMKNVISDGSVDDYRQQNANPDGDVI